MRRSIPRYHAIGFGLALLLGLLAEAPSAAAFRRAPARRTARSHRLPKGAAAAIIARRPIKGRTSGRLRPPPRPVFRSAGEVPKPRAGTVRLYRGTGHPDRVQVSPSMRGRPLGDVPSGERSFFDPLAAGRIAQRHAFGAHDPTSDAVSMTTDLSTARNFARVNRGAVMVYDVPAATFERLPRGDRLIGEYVFKYSAPDRFLVGVLQIADAR